MNVNFDLNEWIDSCSELPVEILPDEDDWNVIHDWCEAHNYEF